MKTLTIKFSGESGSGKSLAIKILKEKGFNVTLEAESKEGVDTTLIGHFDFNKKESQHERHIIQ